MSERAPNLAEAADQIQAHLLRASKFEDGRARNWSLFFFFRILAQAETEQSAQRLQAFANALAKRRDVSRFRQDLEHPHLLSAGLAKQKALSAKRKAAEKAAKPPGSAAPSSPPDGAVTAGPAPDDPARAFLDWLTVVVAGEKKAFVESTTQTFAPALAEVAKLPDALPEFGDHLGATDLEALESWASESPGAEGVSLPTLLALLRTGLKVMGSPDEYRGMLDAFGASHADAGERALRGRLPMVALYELLRQGAPAFAPAGSPEEASEPASAVRSEAREAPRHRRLRGGAASSAGAGTHDRTPITIAFSFPGLQALKLDPATLSSFPDAFQQGMAARAARLQDTGSSAPETWEGELGLPSVHGYFTGGFAVPDGVEERLWRDLREDVAAFNAPAGKRGKFLRMWLGLAFRFLGLEIVHIELGQDPYTVEVGKDGLERTRPLPERKEHFGFRDGVSQPFVDMRLGDPLPGGGTPGPNGTWTPVAPGEIFLDMPDEDGVIHKLPCSDDLRRGATFLVFRKLEQNVTEFRRFLAQQRPNDPTAQELLGAQFVGRWPNGTPLVLSPDYPARGEGHLNDFRYDADDPAGAMCPLGAHIRRANPRDTGGRASVVSRHRILRRGISYGGPSLPDDQPLGDGLRRGLLFIAANSRIDLQFEVVQADWINQGELVGQVGLRRCPLTGANDGTVLDSFLERGAATPVTGIPRFVVNRGGDYFFAPGIDALKGIAGGDRFAGCNIPFEGCSMNDAATPELFDPAQLMRMTEAILSPTGPTCYYVTTPANETFAIVGRHVDVRQALNQRTQAGACEFSVLRYHRSSLNITRGQILLGATDTAPPADRHRERMLGVLNAAWDALHCKVDTGKQIARIARECLDQTLRRVATTGRIDLTADLAGPVAYAVTEKFFGTPGPTWLTELATAIQFSKQHIGNLPSDWIAQLKGAPPPNPGLTTMQLWSALIAADLLANHEWRQELSALARQAGSEMLTQMDLLIQNARIRWLEKPDREMTTLLDAFVTNEKNPRVVNYYSPGANTLTEDKVFKYYQDVALILLEIVGTTMAGIPGAVASMFKTLFENRIDLPGVVRTLNAAAPGNPDPVFQLIYEAERLNPTMPIIMRHCEVTTSLFSGAPIKAGDWVASLVTAANLDSDVFPEPNRFSLAPYVDGPARCPASYLMFGVKNSEKECWGHKKLVPDIILAEIMYAAGRLQGLRTVAGPAGKPFILLGVAPIGFPARFTTLDPPFR